MISHHKTIGMDIKALLSTLWIFVLFNMIFRDLDDIFFAAIEIVALTLIVWCAWKWKK